MAAGDKTEAPTPRRKAEARRRGQVAHSPEVGSVLVLVCGFLVLRFYVGSVYGKIADLMRVSFQQLTLPDFSVTGVTSYGISLGFSYLWMLGPLFAAIVAVSLLGNFMQVGFLFSGHTLKPDVSRINPLKGFSRIFSTQAFVELVKSLAKVGIVGYVTYATIRDRFGDLVNLHDSDLASATGLLGKVMLEIGIKAGAAFLLVAAFDYMMKRRQLGKSLRMSKQELKEEMRQEEGSPEIRRRIRQQQRVIASRRMMQSVPNADVIITNPTHLAVAIAYRPRKMRSPRVTAKGAGLIADRIRQLANENHVPLVENKPLAQALYKSVDIGMEIPYSLYQAVAEVLAFIYRLKGRAHGR